MGRCPVALAKRNGPHPLFRFRGGGAGAKSLIFRGRQPKRNETGVLGGVTGKASRFAPQHTKTPRKEPETAVGGPRLDPSVDPGSQRRGVCLNAPLPSISLLIAIRWRSVSPFGVSQESVSKMLFGLTEIGSLFAGILGSARSPLPRTLHSKPDLTKLSVALRRHLEGQRRVKFAHRARDAWPLP